MNLKNEFMNMIKRLDASFSIPRIASIFLPPFHQGGQPKDEQFMAIALESGAAGISYLLLSDNQMKAYNALQPQDFVGKHPQEFAIQLGSANPVTEIISMASVNAICQHVMREANFQCDYVTDPMGLLSIEGGDRIGMVGLFSGLVDTIQKAGAELVIIERKEQLAQKYRDLPITLDVTKLAACNKILCTGTTLLNHSLDDVLAHCSKDAFISVVGPTAGYFPDPLFACGVDVVGGRVVVDSEKFLERLAHRKRWTDTTRKTCFQKKTYKSIFSLA
jgi:uncharacterized protein (DUF4213/DUF364 family)